MNLYEAFQQALSVPIKVGTNLVHCKCKDAANVAMEGSGSQTVEMMNRERESSKNYED